MNHERMQELPQSRDSPSFNGFPALKKRARSDGLVTL